MPRVEKLEIFVLAGGFGTRLKPAVPDVPKPLALVAGRPFIRYLIDNWIRQGATRLTFLLGHQADKIEAFLDDLREFYALGATCELRAIKEPQPLGTGGAVAHAFRALNYTGPVLVANGDTWLGDGVKQLKDSIEPCIALVEMPNTERYGRVQFNGEKVTSFAEKQLSHGGGWINAGLYKLHSDQFSDWDGRPFSIERELLTSLVIKRKLNVVCLRTDFIDIGIPEDYLRFCRWVESTTKGFL